MKIEITEHIANIFENCPFMVEENKPYANDCFEHCPLAGACLEYWLGDDSENY